MQIGYQAVEYFVHDLENLPSSLLNDKLILRNRRTFEVDRLDEQMYGTERIR